MIQGRGFFQIKQASGQTAYTRAGSFQLDTTGSLVTSDGDLLQPQITIPPTAQSITIAADGTVTYTLPGQTQAQNAGQITLANFQNPAGSELARPAAFICRPTRRAMPPSARRAATKASAPCSRAMSSNRTSASWMSSSI